MARLTPAVMRAFDILELFVNRASTLTAAEVAELTELPRTSVHELVTTLIHRGYLQRDDSGRLSLGMQSGQLGAAYVARFDLLGAATDIARDTANEYGVTCSVAILDDIDVFYLAKVEGREPLVLASSVGKRLPAHATALGKVLLASLRDARLDQLYDGHDLVALMPATITTLDALKAELDRVRARGYATEVEESTPHAACAAVGVRDATGSVVAAVSVTVTLTRWRGDDVNRWVGMAREAANQLSAQLGQRTSPRRETRSEGPRAD